MTKENEADKTTDSLAIQNKIAIVVDPNLERGQIANRCAVLATGLAARHPEIIGPDLRTEDGVELPGFTKVPIVVLSGRETPLVQLAQRAREQGCTTLVFLARAQGLRSYEAYRDSVAGSTADKLDVDAFIAYGPHKALNKVTGSLPALR